MVQVRVHQPVNTDGSINLEAWLDHVVSVDSALDRAALKEACEFAHEVEIKGNPAKHSWADGTSSFQAGLEIAEILADLKLDQDSLVAAGRTTARCSRRARPQSPWASAARST